METRLDQSRIDRAANHVAIATALAAISWTWNQFGTRTAVLASMQDAVLIDLAMRVDRRIPIVFLDNGFHFDETHETMRRIQNRYQIEVEVVGPLTPISGPVEPGACCDLKVDLLELALDRRQAWLSGVRRTDTEHRRDTAIIDSDRRGKVKVSPLAQWDEQDRRRYIETNDVITHRLLDEGYTSIGCATCTGRPSGADARSGRWAGTSRTECGLHL